MYIGILPLLIKWERSLCRSGEEGTGSSCLLQNLFHLALSRFVFIKVDFSVHSAMLLTLFKEGAYNIKYVDHKLFSVVTRLCTLWLLQKFAENLHMCQACYKLANVTSQTTVFYTSTQIQIPKAICPFAMEVPSQVPFRAIGAKK